MRFVKIMFALGLLLFMGAASAKAYPAYEYSFYDDLRDWNTPQYIDNTSCHTAFPYQPFLPPPEGQSGPDATLNGIYPPDWVYGVSTRDAWITTYLNDAQTRGMKVILSCSELVREIINPLRQPPDMYTWTQFTTFINTFKDHPALKGWTLADEPTNEATDGLLLQACQAGANIIRNTCGSTKPIYMVFEYKSLPLGTATTYKDTYDIMMFDHYAVVTDPTEFSRFQYWSPSNKYPSWKEYCTQAIGQANTLGKPFINVLQAQGRKNNSGNMRLPTYNEERFMTFWSVLNGSAGVSFWAMDQLIKEADAYPSPTYPYDFYHNDGDTWRTEVGLPICQELEKMQYAFGAVDALGRVSAPIPVTVPVTGANAVTCANGANILSKVYQDPSNGKYYLITANNGRTAYTSTIPSFTISTTAVPGNWSHLAELGVLPAGTNAITTPVTLGGNVFSPTGGYSMYRVRNFELVPFFSPEAWSATAGGGTQTVTVNNTGSWAVGSDQTWLTFSPSSGTGAGSVTLTAASNPTLSSRTATVTFTFGGTLNKTLAVTQAAPPTATLTMAAVSGTGTTTPAVGSTTVKINTPTTIIAAPETGYHFVNWTESVTGTVANLTGATTTATLTVADTVRTVTANFARDTGNLTMASGGNGTTTPATGTSTINTQTATSISATANTNYHFTNWTFTGSVTVAGANSSPTTATLTGANGCAGTVTANFARNTAELAISHTGTGTAAFSGGITTKTLNTQTSEAITATPGANWHFEKWTVLSGPVTITGASLASTYAKLTGAHGVNGSIEAQFLHNQATLTMAKVGSGTVTPATGLQQDTATPITIEAVPADGYRFVNWTVTSGLAAIANSAAASTTVTLTGADASAATVTANFAVNTYQVVFTAGLNGSITGAKTQTVNHGANCTSVTAVPVSNLYHFVDWSGDYSGTANPLAVTNVTSAKNITANFARNTATLTMAKTGNGTIGGAVVSGANTVNTSAPISIIATPDTATGYHFDNWTVTTGLATIASSAAATTTVTLTGDATVTANFAINTYALTYTAGLNGSITGEKTQAVSHGADGTEVTAVPNAGYHFVKWSDDLTTESRTETDVTGNKAVTASFSINTYDVNFIAGANGTITGAKIQAVDHGSACTSVTAVPVSALYHFVDWSGDYSGTANPLTVTNVTSAKSITANFARNTATLTVSKNGNGTAEFTGVNPLNTAIATPILATPGTGFHFVSWTVTSGLATIENPTATSTTVTLTGGHSSLVTITANFAINSYSVVFTAGENGSIAGVKTQTVNHGANCTQVTAVPAVNYHFASWSGDSVTGNPLTVTNVTSAKNITANFEHNTATLTVEKSGNGNARFTGANPLDTATAIPITATAYAKNHFVNWTVTGSATIADTSSASTTLTLTGGHGSTLTLTANFAEDTAATVIPAAPVISASDGTYVDRVVVTWKAVPTAGSYEVYRNTAVNATTGADFIPLGEVTDTIFEDTSAEFNTVYYYFAKAKNAAGGSEYSAGNSGYVSKAPAVPGAVTASDGTYFDKIQVSWANVTGATSYRVFRTETDTPAPNPALGTNLIGETTALFLDDFGDKIVPPPGDVAKKYYYWIAAKNANVTSAISNSNSGYLSKKGPAAVSASNGTYSNRVVVTWAAVPGATGYDVYSYTDTKFTLNPKQVGFAVTTLECVDSTVTLNTPYYYRVKAKYGVRYDSDFSVSGAVGKTSGSFSPTADLVSNSVQFGNIANLLRSSAYYSIDVPVGTIRLVAALDGTGRLTPANDCDLFAKFANFPTLTSYNAKGVENKLNEILTVSNPSAGIWYFLLYGYTAYSGVTLTVNYYSVADIVLTQVPVNDLAVPFTAVFRGRVVDEIKTGIPNIVIQARNPITGLTSSLARTDASGSFQYSAPISTEGEHTFDFFFTEMPDKSKGTASHTVATRKGCFIEEPNNFFDFSAYLPATPVPVSQQADIMGMQTFLDIRNGWDFLGTVTPGDTYETLWINSTIAEAGDDMQLRGNLDGGLYMFFYGVEGAGVGNDTTTVSALSAVPFVLHVESTAKKASVLAALKTLGLIDNAQELAINGGSLGIVAVAALSNPDEATDGNYNISLFAREQLEILAKIAGNTDISGAVDVNYSGVNAKQITITLANGRKINVVATVFVK